MALEALPFVNWIFWATLTSGSFLVVGGTELLGGTTRGYRLFMAGLLAVCAGILLLSEVNLSPGTVADETAVLRRALVWLVSLCAVAYLVASVVNVRRSGLAIAAGAAGLTSLDGTTTSVHFRFTAVGGDVRIDDVYVDPWKVH